jgi:hypothetical protein
LSLRVTLFKKYNFGKTLHFVYLWECRWHPISCVAPPEADFATGALYLGHPSKGGSSTSTFAQIRLYDDVLEFNNQRRFAPIPGRLPPV